MIIDYGYTVSQAADTVQALQQHQPVSPFAEPGLVEAAPDRYEAYILASTWEFTPVEIRIPVGSTITFYLTSTDVLHGFWVEGTNINVMILPGHVSKLTARFEKPGEYLFVCHEYCGVSHHEMAGKVIVEPRS